MIEFFIRANLIKNDLVEIDKSILNNLENHNAFFIINIKQIFITISNLVDLEKEIKYLYRENNNLSKKYKIHSKRYLFVKYLRNKFVGHISSDLINKAIEWRPETKYSLQRCNEKEVMYIYNLWILETAINTYVNKDGSHKIFTSETDLMYPSDWDRFLEFLSFVVLGGIEYLESLIGILNNKIEKPTFCEHNLQDWFLAGKTEFNYIKK